jgi:hypothetical protein
MLVKKKTIWVFNTSNIFKETSVAVFVYLRIKISIPSKAF